MNKSIFISLFFACVTIVQGNLFAQQATNEAKTLFGSKNPFSSKGLGFFIAPAYGITQMDGGTTSLLNLRGGVSFNDKLSVGVFFNTSINEIKPQSETLTNLYMDYWAVGGFAEYTLFSKKVFHLTFPLYVGYGEVEMDDENGALRLGEANFLQIEPSALLEVNVFKYVRFNLGTGYRFVGQMDYRNFNQTNISGFTGYFGLKIGLFRQNE